MKGLTMAETQQNGSDGHGHHKAIACDGSADDAKAGALGHPKVYLELDSSGSVTCPYCSKVLTADDAEN